MKDSMQPGLDAQTTKRLLQILDGLILECVRMSEDVAQEDEVRERALCMAHNSMITYSLLFPYVEKYYPEKKGMIAQISECLDEASPTWRDIYKIEWDKKGKE